jgi:mycothiol synthase
VARLEIKRQMAQGDIDAVSELIDVATAADDHRPLGEHQWLDLVQGGREGFAGLVAWEPGHDHPVGYAQLTKGSQSWALEFVIDPHHREGAASIGTTLVEAALAVVGNEGGGHVHLWVPKPRPDHDVIADHTGFTPGRELLQMRRSLPVGEPWQLELRAFEPGRDEAAWLEVNNRAFHWHPEQGGWDIETLKSREQQPWFDPAGFLLHERDDRPRTDDAAGGRRLAGFCWTKVHDDHDPPLGEIYVIAVDPDFQGLGLGRSLVLAGLDSLHARGLSVGMLYVDRSNTPAVRLYEDLGFTVDHLDRAYVIDVPPHSATEPAGVAVT